MQNVTNFKHENLIPIFSMGLPRAHNDASHLSLSLTLALSLSPPLSLPPKLSHSLSLSLSPSRALSRALSLSSPPSLALSLSLYPLLSFSFPRSPGLLSLSLALSLFPLSLSCSLFLPRLLPPSLALSFLLQLSPQAEVGARQAGETCLETLREVHSLGTLRAPNPQHGVVAIVRCARKHCPQPPSPPPAWFV